MLSSVWPLDSDDVIVLGGGDFLVFRKHFRKAFFHCKHFCVGVSVYASPNLSLSTA